MTDETFPSGYADVSVVVDGAEDETDSIDLDGLQAWLDSKRQELESEAPTASWQEAEVYVVRHDHALTDEECACVQYLTDHNPEFTILR